MKFAIDRRIDVQGQPTQFYIEDVDSAGEEFAMVSLVDLTVAETPIEAGMLLIKIGEEIMKKSLAREEEAKRARDVQIAAGEAGTA